MPADVEPALEASEAGATAEAASLKKKKCLVVVLLIGLLIAVLTQPKPEPQDVPAVVEASSEGQTATVDASAAPVESVESRIDRLSQVQELERIKWSDIMSLELFVPEPQQLQKHRVNVTRVNAIYGDSTNRAALVGQSIVRQGQPLPDGGKVLHVNQDGIKVGL